MDAADRAQQEQEAELAGHLNAQARRAALEQPGNERCADCGEEIPEERRRAMPSAHRCVGCQAFLERVGKVRKLNHA